MKIDILTDDDGNIGALHMRGRGGKDAPLHSGIRASAGQQLHENVEVPDHLTTDDKVHHLLMTHKVDVSGGQAKLVERKHSGA